MPKPDFVTCSLANGVSVRLVIQSCLPSSALYPASACHPTLKYAAPAAVINTTPLSTLLIDRAEPSGNAPVVKLVAMGTVHMTPRWKSMMPPWRGLQLQLSEVLPFTYWLSG